jgi:hypothetical protein
MDHNWVEISEGHYWCDRCGITPHHLRFFRGSINQSCDKIFELIGSHSYYRWVDPHDEKRAELRCKRCGMIGGYFRDTPIPEFFYDCNEWLMRRALK